MNNDRSKIFIDGAWVQPLEASWVEIENPYTEDIIGRVPSCGSEDVERGVAAAATARAGWAATPITQRAEYLSRLHTALESRQAELVETVMAELGTPVRTTQKIQVGLPLMVLSSIIELAGELELEQRIGNSRIVKDPIGVVGAITPWNYPLHQVVTKVIPALVAGCTVVVKPAEMTPLTAYVLFDAIDEAGFPPGVINLVPGRGSLVGEALASHPDVAMISFTGSTSVGARVAATAMNSIKKVSLELGGKSANVILEDADLDVAVKTGLANAFMNGGQTCTALTRMLVHRSRYEEALTLAKEYAERYTLGDPAADATRMGPMASASQRDSIRTDIDAAVAAGARVVTGGSSPSLVPPRGYFVAPTVIADVAPESDIAQQEIFGPVLTVLPFDDDDEAVRIANDSEFGLAGAVWAADVDRALAVARRMDTGQVDVNGAPFNVLAPFGGYKKSGIGRELGQYGVEEFLEVKAIQLPRSYAD